MIEFQQQQSTCLSISNQSFMQEIPDIDESILGEKQEYFTESLQNHKKSKKLIIYQYESSLIIIKKTKPYLMDIENMIISRIHNEYLGEGIKITRNLDQFSFYGDISNIFVKMKLYCLQSNFNDIYMMEKFIGEGQYGKVYRAKNKQDGLEYAVKVFEKTLLIGDKLRIENELAILRRISHKNIIKFIETFTNEHFIYVVFEVIQGGSLAELLKNIELTEKQIILIVIQILDALSYLSMMGIVHRDIKPQNILIKDINEEIPQLIIIDFGLSEWYQEDYKYSTKRCGTPGYMAPEILGQKVYDFKVDVYSTGIILYRLLSGQSPFQGNNFHEQLLLNTKCLISFKEIKCSPELLTILQSMLESNPLKRLSAQEALQNMKQIIKGRSQSHQIQQNNNFINQKTRSISHNFNSILPAFTDLINQLEDDVQPILKCQPSCGAKHHFIK